MIADFPNTLWLSAFYEVTDTRGFNLEIQYPRGRMNRQRMKR